MGCHVLSCFPCRRSCAAGVPGMMPPVPARLPHLREGRPGFTSGVFRLRVRGMAFLLSAPVPFHPPAGGGTLIRAYPARAPAPLGARFAPARFARLIARARSCTRAGRRAPPLLAESGAFSRRREPGREAAPRGCRFLPPAPYCHWPSGNQVSSTKYFKKENKAPIRSPQSGLRRRAFTRARRGRDASAGGRRRCGGATRLR